jgi:chemotaxis protein CheZ
MDLVESSLPLADATVRNATGLLASLDTSSQQDVRRFVEETRGNLELVRANLSQMMLAQSYQDLTGQILRGVRRLIVEVEAALGELARLTGAKPGASSDRMTSLEGPAIPGVTHNAVTAQSDVDDLMAGLGI